MKTGHWIFTVKKIYSKLIHKILDFHFYTPMLYNARVDFAFEAKLLLSDLIELEVGFISGLTFKNGPRSRPSSLVDTRNLKLF